MPSERRILWVGIANALVLFLGLVGIGVVDTDDTEPVASLSSGAGTTVPGEPADGGAVDPAPTDDGGTPGVAPGPGGPAATTAPGTGGAGTPAAGPAAGDERVARPPADGVYRNRMKSSGGGREDDREVKVRVTTLSRTATETRQRTQTEGDSGGGFGGFSGDAESSWRGDGVYVRSEFGGDEVEADCQPPEQLQIKLPLAEGVTWSNEIECTYTVTTPQGKATGRQKVRTTSTVTGTGTRAVDGREFFVWKVFTDGTFEGSTTFGGRDYPNKGTTKTTTLFVPALGLAAFTETDVTGEGMGQTSNGRSTIELLNHTPE